VPIDVFLVIPQSPGNPPVAATPSTDLYFKATFPNAAVIPIDDYAFAVENPVAIGSASSGAGAGKETFHELVVHKAVDKSSPFLFTASASGGHFAAVQLYLRQTPATTTATSKTVPFLAYEFQTAFVSKIEWDGGAAADRPAETVHLAYGALVVAYQATNVDGTPAPTVRAGWSQITNLGNVQDTIPLR
jgi:type VI secretion system secreted protein Hcp